MGVVAALFGAYLLGSFPTAALVGGRRGLDPTTAGSGNPGATNVYRLMGRRAAAAVLAGDALKGVAAAVIGSAVGGRAGLFACGAVAVVGHCYPLARWSRGGKGVATAGGVGVVALPLAAAAAVAVWLVLARVTGKASLASLLAITVVPIWAAAARRPGFEVATTVAIAVLVVARHRDNLGRLRRGDERTLR